MYSQNEEEKYVLEYFKDKPKGRFLDIGAYDGKTFSNTLALAELGWSGVCIEPEPSSFNGLLQTHKDNDKIECVNAAFATQPGLIRFYDSNGAAVSTTSDSHAKKWQDKTTYRKSWVSAIAWKDILESFGGNFDMISLDVEGTNIELLKTLHLETVKLICVEYDYDAGAVHDYCKGFHEIHRNGENIIMAR